MPMPMTADFSTATIDARRQCKTICLEFQTQFDFQIKEKGKQKHFKMDSERIYQKLNVWEK